MKEIDLLDEKNLKVKTFLVFKLALSDWEFIMTFLLLVFFFCQFLTRFQMIVTVFSLSVDCDKMCGQWLIFLLLTVWIK